MHVLDLIVGALALVGLVVLGGLLWEGIETLRNREPDGVDLDELLAGGADDEPLDGVEKAQACAEALEANHDWGWMVPEVLELEPTFQAGVDALADEATPVDAVVELARHPDGWVASMALAALERRDDVPADWPDAAIRGLPRPSNCEDAFQLRALARHAASPSIGRILARVDGIRPPYVVDFVCFSRKLVIELDGVQHADGAAREHDARRTAWLESRGFRVLRFWNHELDEGLKLVVDAIRAALEKAEVSGDSSPPSPALPAEGREPEESVTETLLCDYLANAGLAP